MKPLVSIISVNYNGVAVTLEMLKSLEDLTYPNVEVIVVDNNSDTPPAIIKEKYPWVNLVVTDKNLGFAGANNLGMNVARGKYYFFLNNDTEVTAGCLEPMVEALERDAKVGAVSPKIYYHEGEQLLQYAGGKALHPVTGWGGSIGTRELDKGQYDTGGITGLTHGAAMMVPANVVDKVGQMPEQFFLYYEELDWCESIKRAGYSLAYEPRSHIYHKESVTVGRKSPLRIFYMTRNRMMYMRRNHRGLTRILGAGYYFLISAPFNVLRLIATKQSDLVGPFLKGVVWNLKPKSRKLDVKNTVFQDKQFFLQSGLGELEAQPVMLKGPSKSKREKVKVS